MELHCRTMHAELLDRIRSTLGLYPSESPCVGLDLAR
ncbi:hypothetical protein [Vibrio phage vB_pir03]|nr:hypothetical protein [Vibrio phage vB_pir03]